MSGLRISCITPSGVGCMIGTAKPRATDGFVHSPKITPLQVPYPQWRGPLGLTSVSTSTLSYRSGPSPKL